MKRTKGKSHCPINFGLEAFGDPWSLLVIRDIVYFGKRTFTEFSDSDEGVAPSVLTARLAELETNGILNRTPDPGDARRVVYTLTENGLALIPVLLEIANWSAGVDAETDAPPEWIEAVHRDKTAMTELITATVRAGGSIFVGSDSVVAALSASGQN
ncbi:winged helix-turn-helix transcriptional regulator [Mycetocola zhujimingii]|uniref:Transcriptional regulator n=1 Tax=Mycetocola zhujimingii TaxID=2079792 RepID=A0A2U1TCN4_9MICO|nr:helix-turn-helix domain-containing protein [Mycetocola zhujimingii]PWC06636.1 transcriptional regulator [Mycetocola zhujimingii]